MPGHAEAPAGARLRRAAFWLSVLLIGQAAAYHLLPKTERTFPARPLKEFPADLGPWHMAGEFEIEPEIQRVLRADDSLNRTYVRPGSQAPVSLFVAFFRSQASGAAPHSPKNCLPGSGYAPMESGTVRLPFGAAGEVEVNRYIVARGDSRSIVLYWYQTPARIVAGEFEAKFWLVADSIRYRRSDTSLVRIVVPVAEGVDADSEARQFAIRLLPALSAFLPRLETPGGG
ncbi:MAG: EpsI family protein [Bryobacteraceae bacterium]|nr:EpsI family protein [Bryobacteraceae bacterium]MCX7602815.1 EpsI family protein [Bryobacteraceae bacterium]